MPRRSTNVTDGLLATVQLRIDMARNASRLDPWYDDAVRMLDIYKGVHWPTTNSDKHRITVNYAQVNVDILTAALAANDPEFMVIPKVPAAEANVAYQKAALSKTWEEINALNAVTNALQDAIITGRGCCFVGWRYETTSATSEGKPEREESNTVVWDNPIVRRVNPLSVFVDPDCDDLVDLKDARWVLEEYTLPLDEVVANPYLSNTKTLRGSETLDKRLVSEDYRKTNTTGIRRVRLWDYWQREGRVHIVVADEQPDKPLLVETWPYPFPTYPYVFMRYRRIPNSQSPQGQIEPAESCIREIDVYRSAQINHDDRYAKGKTAYDSSRITPEGLKALQSGEDGALIAVTGSPHEIFASIPDDPLPPDFYATAATIKADISELMGVDSWMRGQPDRTRRTRGEVEMLFNRASARSTAIQRNFERFCGRIGDLILRLLQSPIFCDRLRYTFITGSPDQEPISGMWNHTRVAGEAQVLVVASSTRMRSPETEQAKWGFMLQSLQPFVQSGLINIVPIIEEAMLAYEVPPQKIRKIIQTATPGQATQIAQLGQAVNQLVGFGKQLQDGVAKTTQVVASLTERVTQLEAALAQGKVDIKTATQVETAKAKTAMKLAEHQEKLKRYQLETDIESIKGMRELTNESND